MQKHLLAFLVIGFSVGLGLAFAIQPNLQLEADFNQPADQQNKEQNEDSDDLVYGSAHEHALFHVVINGTEKNFTAEKFQLNDRYVHLENNHSSIVHKHAKGVDWKMFLDTINVSVNRTGNETLCVNIAGEESCGTGKVVLNNQTANLSSEIRQGDSFVIIIETGEMEQKIREYMKEKLPEDYRPTEFKGREL